MTPPEWPGDPEVTAGPSTEAGPPEPEVLGPVPWEDPARSRLTGFFQTLGEVLLRPASFFARPAQGGPGEPFAFGLIIGTTGSLLGLFWWVLLLLSTSQGVRSAMELPRCDFLPGAAGVLTMGMALTPLAVLIKLAWGSLFLWGAAALLGARLGFAPIWRLGCYATAAAALAVVPFLGSLLAVPIWLFILHQGMRGALGMSFGRALGALVVFLILQALVAALLLTGLVALLGLLLLG